MIPKWLLLLIPTSFSQTTNFQDYYDGLAIESVIKSYYEMTVKSAISALENLGFEIFRVFCVFFNFLGFLGLPPGFGPHPETRF